MLRTTDKAVAICGSEEPRDTAFQALSCRNKRKGGSRDITSEALLLRLPATQSVNAIQSVKEGAAGSQTTSALGRSLVKALCNFGGTGPGPPTVLIGLNQRLPRKTAGAARAGPGRGWHLLLATLEKEGILYTRTSGLFFMVHEIRNNRSNFIIFYLEFIEIFLDYLFTMIFHQKPSCLSQRRRNDDPLLHDEP
ncbi:hypothetical protein HBA54_21865 [Pelagibius litoralis]|uniref:Uncharacterized protein n=1 Tax=Pelagibius litoralis TaxID=374515 RepID=A0A967KHG3_9PROT|nr:hypothetical protein [Pelagibius litoralis]NIA71251.1 hypothetical protein [Pelagibius litoralis]